MHGLLRGRRSASPQRKLKSEDIGRPTDFQHVQHVGIGRETESHVTCKTTVVETDSGIGHSDVDGQLHQTSHLDEHHHRQYPHLYQQQSISTRTKRLNSTEPENGGFTSVDGEKRKVRPPLQQTLKPNGEPVSFQTAPTVIHRRRTIGLNQQSKNRPISMQLLPQQKPPPSFHKPPPPPLLPQRTFYISEGMQTSPAANNNNVYVNFPIKPKSTSQQQIEVTFESLASALLTSMLQESSSRHFVYSYFYNHVNPVAKEIQQQQQQQHSMVLKEHMAHFMQTAVSEISETVATSEFYLTLPRERKSKTETETKHNSK